MSSHACEIYTGNGEEYGEIVATLLDEFRQRGEKSEKDYTLGKGVFPGNVLIDRESGLIVLEASDCITGGSGRNYGHRIFLDTYSPNILEGNFFDEAIEVRSPQEAKQKLANLIGKYGETNWKDLAPRRF